MIIKKYGFFDEEDIIYSLCEEGSLSYVEKMLSKNPGLIKAKGPYKRNLLFPAIKSGNYKLVVFLIKFYEKFFGEVESFVNEKDIFGEIPLNKAFSLQRRDMVKLLLENNSKILPFNLKIEDPLTIDFAEEVLKNRVITRLILESSKFNYS